MMNARSLNSYALDNENNTDEMIIKYAQCDCLLSIPFVIIFANECDMTARKLRAVMSRVATSSTATSQILIIG